MKLRYIVLLSFSLFSASANESWLVESQEDWAKAQASQSGLTVEKGAISPAEKTGTFQSVIKRFDKKRSVGAITLKQSPLWLNWTPVPNIGPANLGDSPIFLQLGPSNYWMFGRYGGGKSSKGFKPQDATLEGFDIPLKTTPFKDQYDAPGAASKRLGGYHAWQSHDMKNWVHHGSISTNKSRWMTNAEYADGKAYFYYDYPNDQDPHVIVDSDLFDGKMGADKGMAVKDPSHGSDAGFIRDLDGNFHCIIEDWSPISANKRSWDSPLAGHFVSKNGIDNFVAQSPPVDERTKPTGKIGTYKHPHWVKEDPANYKTSVAEYEIHSPEQEAYGDWSAISVGGRYYLFGDYDPAGAHGKKAMSVCWFTSESIDEKFEFCSHIGKGHPDPDIVFAEGQFYLATQMKTDYVSSGPWVETAEVRVGVDTDNDGKSDKWSDWQQVKESYDYIEGFAKQVKKTPASLDLSALPEGYGFQFEIKLTDSTENESKPVLEGVELSFKGE
ncbi:hypothetical protein N9B13_01105 [Akkermansiaceae bacterium]|nr:hypothetical protein [Akkermansiaceae bacterium]